MAYPSGVSNAQAHEMVDRTTAQPFVEKMGKCVERFNRGTLTVEEFRIFMTVELHDMVSALDDSF